MASQWPPTFENYSTAGMNLTQPILMKDHFGLKMLQIMLFNEMWNYGGCTHLEIVKLRIFHNKKQPFLEIFP